MKGEAQQRRDTEVIKRVKQELDGKPNIVRTSGGREHTRRCICTNFTAKLKIEKRCRMKVTQERIWAGRTLLFCEQHAKEWDDTVTKALTGNWEGH